MLDIFDVPLLKDYEKATVNIYMLLEPIKLVKYFTVVDLTHTSIKILI